MWFLGIGILGIVLLLADYGNSVLYGAALCAIDAVVFTIYSIFRENTGDLTGDLNRAAQELGGSVKDKDDLTGRRQRRSHNTIEFRWGRNTIAMGIETCRRGMTEHKSFSVSAEVPPDIEIKVGMKTATRAIDTIADDCVFSNSETVSLESTAVLVAGKEKEGFIAKLIANPALQTAVLVLVRAADFGEFRVSHGKLSAAKVAERGDTAPENIRRLLGAVQILLEAL